jgi:hypothetical protein
MSNNKSKLRTDIRNMYGEFLNSGEVNVLVNKYNGSNASTIKKEAYGTAYGKYYNSVFNNAIKLIKKSPPCPSGAKGQILADTYKRAFKAAAQQVGLGVATGSAVGAGVGAGVDKVAMTAFKAVIASGHGVKVATGAAIGAVAAVGGTVADALKFINPLKKKTCQTTPNNSACPVEQRQTNTGNNFGNISGSNNGSNSESNNERQTVANSTRQNGRPSRSTAGQVPARIASGNRNGAPQARSRS